MLRNYKLLSSKSHTLLNQNVNIVTQTGSSKDPIQPKYSIACLLEIMPVMLQHCHKLNTQHNSKKIILSLPCIYQLMYSKGSLITLLNPSILVTKAKATSELRSQLKHKTLHYPKCIICFMPRQSTETGQSNSSTPFS